jgi:hypothetical protein
MWLLMRHLVGIDLERNPGALACIPKIQERADLLARVFVLIAQDDRFAPDSTYTMGGARTYVLENTTHVGFLYSPQCYEVVRTIVSAVLKNSAGGSGAGQ